MDTSTSSAGLHRVLGLRDLIIYGIAFMTPIAPAYIFGIATEATGGMLASAYAVALLAMLFTAGSYGHMASAFPVAGSTYSYTQKGIHPYLGFIAGWSMFLDYVLVPLIVFMVGAAYANAAFPAIPYEAWVFIIALIVTTVNYYGVEMAAKTNLLLVGLMGLIVLVCVGSCFSYLQGAGMPLLSAAPFYQPDGFSMDALLAGSAIACFSFLGFDSITTMSEEALHPKRDIGRAAVFACILGGLIFIVQSYAAQLVWPDHTSFSSLDTALFEVAERAGGLPLAMLYTAAVVLSTMTAGLTGQSSAARLLYGMGRDQVLPKGFFTYLHPKYKTPTYNILLMCCIGIVGALYLDISLVTELLNFGGLFGFMCVNISVISYYFFRQRQRRFFSYLLFPLIGFSVCAYLWLHLSHMALFIGFSWMAAGLLYLTVSTRFFQKLPATFSE